MTDAPPVPSYEGMQALPYVAVRITSGVQGNPAVAAYGTGFFYGFKLKGGDLPAIVSNKHVLMNRDWNTFAMPVLGDDGNRLLGPAVNFTVEKGQLPIIGHPNPAVDLAIIPLGPIVQSMEAQGKRPAAALLSKDAAIPGNEIPDLHVATQVLMVGFPNGLMDAANNLPVVRRGSLATPYYADYQGKPDFAVDIAAFGGSSGSPVFAFFDGFRSKGGDMIMGGQQIYLLGVLHSGPTLDAHGVVVQEPVPTQMIAITRQMINIGICAKAALIEDFVPELEKLVGREKFGSL